MVTPTKNEGNLIETLGPVFKVEIHPHGDNLETILKYILL